jgi:hypothetical protein
VRREACNHGPTITFVVGKYARIFDKVDANPRSGTQVIEVSLDEVLLSIRKVVSFDTMGNQMVNKGMCEASRLTLGVFLLKTRCS